MKILLTGSTGFLGNWVLKYLQSTKFFEITELILLVRDKSKLPNINIKHQIIIGNLQDKELLSSIIKNVDMVIHLAGEVRVGLKWELYENNNIQPTKTIVENLKDNQQFIYISSMAVYGVINDKISIDENYSTTNPFDNYGISKIESEKIIIDISKKNNYKYIILRPSAITGPGDLKITTPYLDAIKNKKLMLINGSHNIIPMIHPGDVAQAIILAIKNMGKYHTNIYNLTGFQDPIRDVIKSYCETFGYPVIDKSIPYFIAATFTFFKDMVSNSTDKLSESQNLKLFTANTLLNINKIQDQLGYSSEFNRVSTIKAIGEWYNTLNID